MRLTEINAEIGLPWGLGKVGGTWRPDEAERLAAWELLVELATRITLTELRPGEGLLRESLNSLHAIFGITREILRRYGPNVARASSGESTPISFGVLAIAVLNGGIRPLLTYWHPTLADYEQRRPTTTSSIEWERTWDRADELRDELDIVRNLLTAFAGIIAEVCDARPVSNSLVFKVPNPPGQLRPRG